MRAGPAEWRPVQRLSVLLLVAICFTPARADDKLPGPDADALRSIPGIHSVAVHRASNGPTHRIIHIRNWHFVQKADFAADLRSVGGNPLSSDEIDARYEKFLAEVESVQAEQRMILKRLIDDHGLNHVYIEGLTEARLPAFQKRIEALREFERHKPQGRTPIEQLLLHEYRLDLLEIGAAGQLYLTGELAEILPAEDADAYAKANPVQENGALVFDEERNATREDFIVSSLLNGGPISVVVLGGAHDLANNAERLSKGACEVIAVTTEAYQEVAE